MYFKMWLPRSIYTKFSSLFKRELYSFLKYESCYYTRAFTFQYNKFSIKYMYTSVVIQVQECISSKKISLKKSGRLFWFCFVVYLNIELKKKKNNSWCWVLVFADRRWWPAPLLILVRRERWIIILTTIMMQVMHVWFLSGSLQILTVSK